MIVLPESRIGPPGMASTENETSAATWLDVLHDTALPSPPPANRREARMTNIRRILEIVE